MDPCFSFSSADSSGFGVVVVVVVVVVFVVEFVDCVEFGLVVLGGSCEEGVVISSLYDVGKRKKY